MDLDSCTSYQVSDSLKHRHPYSSSEKSVLRGGTGVVGGFGIGGLQDSIRVLKAEGKSADAVENALMHLLRQLSSCEMKTRLVLCGLLDALLAVSVPPGKVSAKADRLVCLSLRQLAVLPTSMHAMAKYGCIELAVAILEQQDDKSARLAACQALLQMSETWDGRSLLLGMDLPSGMVPSLAEESLSDEDRNLAAQGKEALARRIVSALASKIDPSDPHLMLAALQCLEGLTTVSKGLQFALCEDVFRDINQVLEGYLATGDEWVFDDNAVDVIHHSATLIWNIALDDFGKDKAIEIPLVPYTLGRLLLHTLAYPSKVMKMKAAITGAISALYVRAQTKMTAAMPLRDGENMNVAAAVVTLLKQANAIYQPVLQAKRGGEAVEISELDLQYTVSVVTNCTQSIRLMSELPSARKIIKELIADEPLELKRQIYFSTQFQAEFLGENYEPF